MTPLPATFNIAPAALLKRKDRNGNTKPQCPTALLLPIVNTILMHLFVFRFLRRRR